MTNDERLDMLIGKMREFLKEKVKSLPEQGRFQTHSVTISYPGTAYEALLIYEFDLIDGGQRNRRLRASVRRQGSDKMISCYLFKGAKAECLAWLEETENQQVLKKVYAGLLVSAEQADD